MNNCHEDPDAEPLIEAAKVYFKELSAPWVPAEGGYTWNEYHIKSADVEWQAFKGEEKIGTAQSLEAIKLVVKHHWNPALEDTDTMSDPFYSVISMLVVGDDFPSYYEIYALGPQFCGGEKHVLARIYVEAVLRTGEEDDLGRIVADLRENIAEVLNEQTGL